MTDFYWRFCRQFKYRRNFFLNTSGCSIDAFQFFNGGFYKFCYLFSIIKMWILSFDRYENIFMNFLDNIFSWKVFEVSIPKCFTWLNLIRPHIYLFLFNSKEISRIVHRNAWIILLVYTRKQAYTARLFIYWHDGN
jgi:hypothetical protein